MSLIAHYAGILSYWPFGRYFWPVRGREFVPEVDYNETMNVLLVDDHALFRAGVALLLQNLDHNITVVEASSLNETFQLGQPKSSSIDLVLLDLNLPDGSGLDAIGRVRQLFEGAPVVVLSSTEDKPTVLRALDCGAMGFIPKTSASEVLLGALKLVLSKGIYLPPSVFLGERVGSPTASIKTIPAPTPRTLGLTPRESDVLRLILEGKPSKSICRELNLSISTVKAHTVAVLRALNVSTRTQAIVAAGRLGLRL